MATKWCLQCGSEYIDAVQTCPDCGIDLVGEAPMSHDAEVEADPSGKAIYELHDWAVESRVLLEQLLEGESILHAWEGTSLAVPAALRVEVDTLVEHVEATTLPTLDPDSEKLVYELSGLTDDQVNRVAEALASVQIAFEFDEQGDLVVLAIDEERVEDLLDSIENPDALKADMDGDYESADAQEALSELFLAADRLKKHARDHEGVLGLVKAAATIVSMEVPFGFAPAVWHDITGQTARLKEILEADSETDDQIEIHAGELRDLLRSYV